MRAIDADALKAQMKDVCMGIMSGIAPYNEPLKVIDNATTILQWIPCSERLPSDRDWYLGVFKEPDTGWINPIPFICDYAGIETPATTRDLWIIKECTDIESPAHEYYRNLICVAWMPLPEPYRRVDGIMDAVIEILNAPTIVVDKDELPSAQERKKGEWITDGCIERCNRCGEPKDFPHWNFCPNCGADMRGERRSE